MKSKLQILKSRLNNKKMLCHPMVAKDVIQRIKAKQSEKNEVERSVDRFDRWRGYNGRN